MDVIYEDINLKKLNWILLNAVNPVNPAKKLSKLLVYICSRLQLHATCFAPVGVPGAARGSV